MGLEKAHSDHGIALGLRLCRVRWNSSFRCLDLWGQGDHFPVSPKTWCSKCGPWTRGMGSTWERVRNADSQVLPQPHWPGSSRGRAQESVSSQARQGFWCTGKSETIALGSYDLKVWAAEFGVREVMGPLRIKPPRSRMPRWAAVYVAEG